MVKRIAFPFCGARAERGPMPPHLSYVDHTQLHTHTHPAGLLWTSDHLVAEAAATFKTHNKHNLPSTRFESTIPAIERPQTYI